MHAHAACAHIHMCFVGKELTHYKFSFEKLRELKKQKFLMINKKKTSMNIEKKENNNSILQDGKENI